MKTILKLAAVGMVVVACVIGALTIWSNKPTPITERPVKEVITYRVGSGDTIWHIATRYIPKDGDVRLYIWEIERLNGRKLSRIYVGDEIIIPVYEEAEK